MWIVKRMSTARIVVLIIALSAGVAAHMSGSDSSPPPAEPVAQSSSMDVPERSEMLARARLTGTFSLAPSSKSSKGRVI
jgi:hypothetical protein